MSNKPVYIFLGPPGAGKGTQAVMLAQKLNLLHISTGVIFREAITSGSELGKQVKDLYDRGNLIPNELTNQLLAQRLEQGDAVNGVILDGYPRNLEQAAVLEKLLENKKFTIVAVIDVDVPQTVLFERISKRSLADGRTDDSREVLANRLQVYFTDTAPLTDFYKNKGVLKVINGLGTVDEVSDRISSAIEEEI